MIDSGFHDCLGQARKLLMDSPIHELRTIEVESKGEEIHLRGSVGSFYLKQMAQETVRSATRGVPLVNELCVEN
jgi:osmotically-inducible protein OsmY